MLIHSNTVRESSHRSNRNHWGITIPGTEPWKVSLSLEYDILCLRESSVHCRDPVSKAMPTNSSLVIFLEKTFCPALMELVFTLCLLEL